MGKFQGLGELFGQIIVYIYIWIAIVIIFLIIFISLITKYIHDKKINKVENDDKKRIIMRICIYLVLGLLIFILSPLILSPFL